MDLTNLFKKLTERKNSMMGMDQFSKYAVLIPIVKKDDELSILFEVRSYHLRRQPGDICFPGGKIDESDEDAMRTAIRETKEELGIGEENIHYVSPLDFLVNPFGTIVYPYVGYITAPEKIIINKAEVAEIFTVPISFLQKVKPEIYNIDFQIKPEKDFPFEHIIGGTNYKWQPRKMGEYFYYYEDRVIWGLTARILAHFLEVIGVSTLE